MKFPEWYYGGPYLRVTNPDTDLPRRDPEHPLTPESRLHVEADGSFDGERIVAPFGDANRVDDMLGGLTWACEYPNWPDDWRYRYPTIQGQLASISLRLETKLRHKPGRIRANWFSLALAQLQTAGSLFAAGDYEQGRTHVREARDLIEQGNRASRRKVSFVVGPDGVANKV